MNPNRAKSCDEKAEALIRRKDTIEEPLARNSVYHEESPWGPICRVRPIGLIETIKDVGFSRIRDLSSPGNFNGIQIGRSTQYST